MRKRLVMNTLAILGLWVGRQRMQRSSKTDDELLVLQDNGELLVGHIDDTGFVETRRYPIADAATWASPAISKNRFFIKDVSSLTLWTVE